MASAEKQQKWVEQAEARQARDLKRALQPQRVSYVKVFLAVLAALLVALWVANNVQLI
jgi:hypothetical protein